jgi:hypothetical protein
VSDTPETDKAIFKILSSLQSGTEKVVHAEICAKLERERDEARTRCQDLETAFANFANERFEEIQKVRKERDEARKHLAAANKGAEINAHINNSLTAKLAEARGVLQEIANASHFDNIGNWARNKARQALEELK